MALFPLGILSAAGAGGGPAAPSAYELISSTILGSTQSDVVFSSLGDYASTYKHLQIRTVLRAGKSAGDVPFLLRVNGITATNYRYKIMYGTGTSAASFAGGSLDNGIYFGNPVPGATAASGLYAGVIIDILDAYSTTKNKTVRGMTSSFTSVPAVQLCSGVLFNTAAVSSLTIYPDTGGWVAGSRFSIYGIKG
jgi:hypothetical protein